MATRLLIWTVGLGGFFYMGSLLFSQRDEEVKKILADKQYAEAGSEADRKKAMFLNVLQNAAAGGKPMYRQSKEEIESSLSKKI